ncbi:MAG: CheR family methyltransferase [Halioglobus sp.]
MNILGQKRVPTLSDQQESWLLSELHDRAGITVETPRGILDSYVEERMAVTGASNAEDYLLSFREGITSRAEWLALVDLLTVKETRFFRQAESIACYSQYLQDLVVIEPPHELNIWSVGCSTGQELYSLGMVAEDLLRETCPNVEWHGIGTDLSFAAVAKAQSGVYSDSEVASLPEVIRARHMAPAPFTGWKMSADILARTHFFHSNLLHVCDTPFTDFNVIFCQNVLIYFDRDQQYWILDQLIERLRPGGLLILGAGEAILWSSSQLERMSFKGATAFQKLEN